MTIPSDPKKIRERIRRYERNFKSEPDYRDGSGSRYLLGPLYLILGDTPGALAHYNWFEKTFPDDSGEPFHALGWALAAHRSCDAEGSLYRLRRTHCGNPYIIPACLGVAHGQPIVHRGSNWEEESYVLDAPQILFAPWQPQELAWLKTVWKSGEFREFVKDHIEIVSQLAVEPVGRRRTALVNALFALPEYPEQKKKPAKGGKSLH